MQAPQPNRESLVAVLGVGVPCLVLCHFLVHGLGFGLLLLCLPVVGVIVGCRIRFLRPGGGLPTCRDPLEQVEFVECEGIHGLGHISMTMAHITNEMTAGDFFGAPGDFFSKRGFAFCSCLQALSITHERCGGAQDDPSKTGQLLRRRSHHPCCDEHIMVRANGAASASRAQERTEWTIIA
jgi:hypothetical protein